MVQRMVVESHRRWRDLRRDGSTRRPKRRGASDRQGCQFKSLHKECRGACGAGGQLGVALCVGRSLRGRLGRGGETHLAGHEVVAAGHHGMDLRPATGHEFAVACHGGAASTTTCDRDL